MQDICWQVWVLLAAWGAFGLGMMGVCIREWWHAEKAYRRIVRKGRAW